MSSTDSADLLAELIVDTDGKALITPNKQNPKPKEAEQANRRRPTVALRGSGRCSGRKPPLPDQLESLAFDQAGLVDWVTAAPAFVSLCEGS